MRNFSSHVATATRQFAISKQVQVGPAPEPVCPTQAGPKRIHRALHAQDLRVVDAGLEKSLRVHAGSSKRHSNDVTSDDYAAFANVCSMAVTQVSNRTNLSTIFLAAYEDTGVHQDRRHRVRGLPLIRCNRDKMMQPRRKSGCDLS